MTSVPIGWWATAAALALTGIAGCALLTAVDRPLVRTPDRATYDSATVRPQYDRRVVGHIDRLDGTDVRRYLDGWGVRPKLPEVAVAPGAHTLQVECYDRSAGTPSHTTATVRFTALANHLYVIRFGERNAVARLLRTAAGVDDSNWTAWVEDEGVLPGVHARRAVAAPIPPAHRRHRVAKAARSAAP